MVAGGISWVCLALIPVAQNEQEHLRSEWNHRAVWSGVLSVCYWHTGGHETKDLDTALKQRRVPSLRLPACRVTVDWLTLNMMFGLPWLYVPLINYGDSARHQQPRKGHNDRVDSVHWA